MKSSEFVGKRFGKLTVVADSGKRKGKSVLWRCHCDCGGETLAIRRQLASGHLDSCGCASHQDSSGRQAEDLTGRQFGDLTVIRRVENKSGKVCWLCKCKCGNEHIVSGLHLKSGHTQSCGCRRHEATSTRKNLIGQRFGRLTVIAKSKRTVSSKNASWLCRCDCGNEVDVFAGNLLRGRTLSCGCLNREQSTSMHDHLHYQDDTCLERLERVQNEGNRNKAGFRGLFLTKSGKYRASITFQKKHYTLGYFDDFDDAMQARLEAEDVLQAGYVKAFKDYEARAAADPRWARKNPFFFTVFRTDKRFEIRTNEA